MKKGKFFTKNSEVIKVPSYDEELLIKRAVEGDQDAFKILVSRYQKKMFNIAYSMVRDPDDALDIVQEAFLKGYKNLSKFEGKSKFYTWLYRIVLNLCIDFVRKEKRKPAPISPSNNKRDDSYNFLENISNKDESISPYSELSSRELQNEIWKAIQALPPHHKEVIILREIEGLSYEEIANVLQCPKGTVMSRIHHARLKMREMLSAYLEMGKKLPEKENNFSKFSIQLNRPSFESTIEK